MRKPLLSITLFFVGAPVFAAAPLYVETEILAPPGATLYAGGLNNNGDIAVTSVTNGFATGYVYLQHSHTLYALPRPFPNGSGDQVYGINDYGKVAGDSSPFGEPPQATVWYLTGGFEVLDSLGDISSATAVSNDGQVTETEYFPNNGASGAFYWAWKPSLHKVPVPLFNDVATYVENTANAINNFSHIVGDSTLSQFTSPGGPDFITGDHAYLFANGTLTDLGVLGNPDPSTSLGISYAYGLNNKDDVVGQSEVSVPSADPNCPGCVAFHAFLWHAGKLSDLGNLGHVPGWNSSATAINDVGEIVGSADANVNNQPTSRAFVYIDGVMYNLTFMVYARDLNVRLVKPMGINCNGWIVANGYNTATPTVNRVYLLTPKVAPIRAGCPIPK